MIFLRLAHEPDLLLMLAWRSNPLIFEGFYSQEQPLVWQEHLDWFRSRNEDWRTFIIELVEDDTPRPVGVVTIGQMDYWEPETGIYVGEVSLWSKGIGKQALRQAIDYLKQKGYKYTRTTILDSNERSIKLYLSLGFKRIGEARPGESLYRKEL